MFEVRTQVGDGMWTFEQEQKLANIAVNARETQLEIHDKTKIQVTRKGPVFLLKSYDGKFTCFTTVVNVIWSMSGFYSLGDAADSKSSWKQRRGVVWKAKARVKIFSSIDSVSRCIGLHKL